MRIKACETVPGYCDVLGCASFLIEVAEGPPSSGAIFSALAANLLATDFSLYNDVIYFGSAPGAVFTSMHYTYLYILHA